MQPAERSELLSGLDARVRHAARVGTLVFIGGEAGVGKTSLARSLVERCPRRRPRVVGCVRSAVDAPAAGAVGGGSGGTERERHGLLTALLAELAGHTVMVEPAQTRVGVTRRRSCGVAGNYGSGVRLYPDGRRTEEGVAVGYARGFVTRDTNCGGLGKGQ